MADKALNCSVKIGIGSIVLCWLPIIYCMAIGILLNVYLMFWYAPGQ